MNIGIIGSGRVGFSIGKYLADKGLHVTGYYDIIYENAVEAAEFTNTDVFGNLEELVNLSDTLFITTPDDIIIQVWDCIKKMSIDSKTICHFSGSLSSVVFSRIEDTKAYGCSIHPMLAFEDKFSSFKQLNNAYFTIEGNSQAVNNIKSLFRSLGNSVIDINADSKDKYHAAASILTNYVVGLLDMGYSLLEQCGFTREEAIRVTSNMVRGNVDNIMNIDTINALTGPIERGDADTVIKHLDSLCDEDKIIYKALGLKLVALADTKNPDKDYSGIRNILS